MLPPLLTLLPGPLPARTFPYPSPGFATLDSLRAIKPLLR